MGATTGSGSERARVLVVGGNAVARRALAGTLRGSFAVVEGRSAVHALVQLGTKTAVQAIVTELELGPGMDGLDLLAEVERRAPSVFRILVTAAKVNQRLDTAIQAGLVEWLIEEPRNRLELLDAVQKGVAGLARAAKKPPGG